MPLLSSVSASFGSIGKRNTPRGSRENPAVNAIELVSAGNTTDGPYWIKASAAAPLQQIYCILDPVWDGGGWMVLLHNAAYDILYDGYVGGVGGPATTSHIPRLLSGSTFVGSSGPNRHDFLYNWSHDATDIQFTKAAWCAYGWSVVNVASYSISGNVVTLNTSIAHNFKTNETLSITGITGLTSTTSNPTFRAPITSIPSPTSLTFNFTAADASLTTVSGATVASLSTVGRTNPKNIFGYAYGTFNSPTTIPSTSPYIKFWDNPGINLPWLPSGQERLRPSVDEDDPLTARPFRWFGLYDQTTISPFRGTPFTPPAWMIGTAATDGTTATATGILGLRDGQSPTSYAAYLPPEGTSLNSARGMDDHQDGNSLGDAWGTGFSPEYPGGGRGSPVYFMVK